MELRAVIKKGQANMLGLLKIMQPYLYREVTHERAPYGDNSSIRSLYYL